MAIAVPSTRVSISISAIPLATAILKPVGCWQSLYSSKGRSRVSDRKFLEVTDACNRKVMINIDDISKVRSPSDNDLFAPRNDLGAVHLKGNTVQYTLEPYYEIQEALAGLCEIKSIKE